MAAGVEIRTTPFQKLLLIAFAVIFIVLASLTASLPLNLPWLQETESTTQKGTEFLDAGDTAWVIISTIFGFLVGPTASYLYGEWGQCFLSLQSVLTFTGPLRSKHIRKRGASRGDHIHNYVNVHYDDVVSVHVRLSSDCTIADSQTSFL
jgi:hypothetical protein